MLRNVGAEIVSEQTREKTYKMDRTLIFCSFSLSLFLIFAPSLRDIYLLSHYYDYFNSIEQLDWQAANIEYTHLHSNTSGRRCVAKS